jgi:hypothetical protein
MRHPAELFGLLALPALLVPLASCGDAPPLAGGAAALSPERAVAIERVDAGPEAVLHDADPPRRWLGVAASPRDAAMVAGWTKTEVILSTDGGRTYRTVLDGEGDVDVAAVDARGAVMAVRRHHELGVLGADGVEHWHAIPHATKTIALLPAAGVITWHGVTRRDGVLVEAIAFSSDEGSTWTFPSEPALGNFANQVTVEDDGTARIMGDNEADCGGGYQVLYEGNVAGGEWKHVDWALDTPSGFGVGAGGWAYGIGACGTESPVDPERLCGQGPSGEAAPVLPATHARSLAVVSRGAHTWATIDGRLASLDEGRVTFAAKTTTPRGLRLTGIDAEGQPVGVAAGVAMRWARAGSWETLFAR